MNTIAVPQSDLDKLLACEELLHDILDKDSDLLADIEETDAELLAATGYPVPSGAPVVRTKKPAGTYCEHPDCPASGCVLEAMG